MTKLFKFSFPELCDLNYPWRVPNWGCQSCGRNCGPMGYSYPSVTPETLDERWLRLMNGPKLAWSEFDELAKHLRAFFPEYALIDANVTCGSPTGSVLFRHKDMLFGRQNVLLTEKGMSAFENAKLGCGGVTPVLLKSVEKGKKEIPLYEIEIPAILTEPPSYYDSDQCNACAGRKRIFQGKAAIHKASIDPHYDIMGFGFCSFRYIIVTEKFREFVSSVHSGKGLSFPEIPILEE